MRPNHFYLDKEFEVTVKVTLNVPASVSYTEACALVQDALKTSPVVSVRGFK